MVAAAITDKGVTTAADATFVTMANNVGSIKTSISRVASFSFQCQIPKGGTSGSTTVSTGYKGKVLNTSIFVIPTDLHSEYGTQYPKVKTNFRSTYNDTTGVVSITMKSEYGFGSNDGPTILWGSIIVLG